MADEAYINGAPATQNAQGVTVATTDGAKIAGGSDGGALSSTGGNAQFQGGAGQDAFIIQAGALAKSSGLTNGIDADTVVFGFSNAGTWSATNNDFIALTGFGAGSTLTFDHYGQPGGVTDNTIQFYTVHDTTTGNDYTIYVRSLNGNLLGTGDYHFF
jgi:hypothetical protein